MAAAPLGEQQPGKREAPDGAEEPLCKKEKTGDAVAEEEKAPQATAGCRGEAEVVAGRDDVAWLSEAGGRRLRKLESIANADLKVAPDGDKLLVSLREGAAGGVEWAEQCVQAMCALRTGRVIDVHLLPPKDAWTPPVSLVDVPREEARSFIQGKAGARLQQLSEEHDVIAVFGQEAAADKGTVASKPAAGLSLEVGALMEAKYEGGNRWFEVKVVAVGPDTVRVKWTYDDDVPESEVPREDLRALPQQNGEPAEQGQATPLEVGALVDAKFGDKDRWFEAVILRVDESTVKVKWTYDGDVPPSEVAKSSIKAKPKLATDRLYIFGPHRARLELELKVLNLAESKVPGFVSSRPRASDEGPGIGWSVVRLLNDGELKAKAIGKGGSVRIKIGKACGTSLEYIGNLAFVVGTGQERTYTAKLLELVQMSSSGSVDSVPGVLEAICTRVLVPHDASPMVTGKQRATMNQIEEETGTLSFWAPNAAAAPSGASAEEAKVELSEGKMIEGRFKNRWFEATILEINRDDTGELSVKVRWDYDENETSVLPVSDIREVADGQKAKQPARDDILGERRTLVIFGPERSRKLAELRVMATVELKCPGTYKSAVPAVAAGAGFGVETLELGPHEARRCPEKRWRAAAAAANCLAEQIGEALHLAGTGAERARARDYIQWIAMARPSVPEASSRPDVEELLVPGSKRQNLVDHVVGLIELETQTLAFFEGGASSTGDGRLFVCSHDAKKRTAAAAKLREQQERAPPPPPTATSDDDSWGGPQGPPRVVYVVSKEEEERRRKRAERFAAPPGKKR